MKGIPRLIRDFLLAMAVLTFFCRKLDALRTPVVETTAPFSGSLTDASGTETMYDCIVPRQALSRQDNFWYVYVYAPAAETGFPGSATGAAVRTLVTIQAQAGGLAAIDGYLTEDARVVLSATTPLQGERVAVKTGEEGSP